MTAAVLTMIAAGTAAAQTSGTFTDGRDGKTYKTAAIGGKTWMAENLNYKPKSGKSWCYENKDSYCGKYGRLYDWNTAMAACPSGYHLPSRGEWADLAKAAGGTGDYGGSGAAGKQLKAASGWNDYKGKSGDGTDEYGFSALPNGFRYYADGVFDHAGYYGYWWTATERGGGDAYERYMGYDFGFAGEQGVSKRLGVSVRCAAD
ncbi:hypothetical protein R80B4_00672 [Fibrobacteres bacterium R8-0-B4]